MNNILILGGLTFLIAGPRHSIQLETVNVAVYYETLCGDSRRFIVNQLYPTWQALRAHLHIDFIPYGKAEHKKNNQGKWEFDCQHGPQECDGNKIHACIQKRNLPDTIIMAFIKCHMISPTSQSAIQCAREAGFDFGPSTACASGDEGSALLAHHGDHTKSLRPSISFVPTIAINNDLDSQSEALSNLKAVVCQKFKGPKPSQC